MPGTRSTATTTVRPHPVPRRSDRSTNWRHSSPAAALTPNASLTHAHRTYHFEGDPADLDDIARTALGVGLSAIDAALR